MTLALQTLSSQFRLLKLQITVQLQQTTKLPDFKGSMLHGWLGHALKGVNSEAYHILFSQHDANQPKPYIICPNDDHKSEYKKGELLRFELSLFGDAVQLAASVIEAVNHGSRLGFGRQRTPFKVLSVASVTPYGIHPAIVPTRLEEWCDFKDIADMAIDAELALEFVTPLRSKYKGQVIQQPVDDLNFYCNQVIRRLVQLSRFWVIDNEALFDSVYQQRLPIHIEQSEAHGYFEDWQRFSLRQKEQLPFGGVKGQVSFYGHLGLAPILMQIAAVLHIGGKTTFGLGKTKLIY
jgi:hypothetical protein